MDIHIFVDIFDNNDVYSSDIYKTEIYYHIGQLQNFLTFYNFD